ncbi:MAG: hypothetical protein HQL99_16535 [Magnetococcales bacterium]|nr:hypothetical protein [Magnetococcales bacterium]
MRILHHATPEIRPVMGAPRIVTQIDDYSFRFNLLKKNFFWHVTQISWVTLAKARGLAAPSPLHPASGGANLFILSRSESNHRVTSLAS